MNESFENVRNWISCITTGNVLAALGIGLLVSLVMFWPALWLAWCRTKPSARTKKAGLWKIADAVLTVLLFLPPTTLPMILLAWQGENGITGMLIVLASGYEGTFPCLGCILAAALAAFPIVYRYACHGFADLDPDVPDAAQTLGIRKRTLFRRIVLPHAALRVADGAFLSAARAAGESGAAWLVLEGFRAAALDNTQHSFCDVAEEYYAAAWILALLLMLVALIPAGILHYMKHRRVKGAGR